MSDKKPTYEDLRHELDTNMLRASSLVSEAEQQDFVLQTFIGIYQHYQDKHVHHAEYIKLTNRLAAFKAGAFNDYLDTLAGSAQMGMLDILVEESKRQNVAEQSRQRSRFVTDLTGRLPVQPEE